MAADGERPGPQGPATAPGGLLDVLGVAAVVLDGRGRIALWSPPAEALFGHSSADALGRDALDLLVGGTRPGRAWEDFTRATADGGVRAGAFPARHKDGRTVEVEFRTMRLQAGSGQWCVLGITSERRTLARLERDLALSARMVGQAPIGLAVLDTELRYVLVNEALERINGVSAADHLGRTPGQVLGHLDVAAIEERMRQVLATGEPVLEEFATGRPLSDFGREHAWTSSYYRLDDRAGDVLGLAVAVTDVTAEHEQAQEASRARRRLSLVADASMRVGTTLDVAATARELADVTVPEVADTAAVDLLDTVLTGRHDTAHDRTPHDGGGRHDGTRHGSTHDGEARFRAMAFKAAHPGPERAAADPVGEVVRYRPDRLIAQCVASAHPVFLPVVRPADLGRIARDEEAAGLLEAAGVHSYLAMPLIARGRVLGALDLKRTRNPAPFDQDDLLLATELAARAAVAIDNARWYQRQRHTALTLQRHLLPPHDAVSAPGLAIAHRYQPAGEAEETGGDWFDVVPLDGDRTALVVGDVMGSGINAAATMGQLRTAARVLARLGLEPDDILTHLDETTRELGESTATCLVARYDPATRTCLLANAGHLPPVHVRAGVPRPVRLDTGAPLGVGGIPFRAAEHALRAGDDLLLYTDGLIEVRDQDIDQRLQTLVDLLAGPRRTLDDTCDLLLAALRRPDTDDDVALLIARVLPTPAAGRP
ncbi:SpoIIE family protein phosphatase [Kitasatospora sp. NPDC085895]|uniref:SpoIIE family protein phosphatase n=1 Tax=Kitasatospora sp. NPDC085895 TaxID=3155057 RepID=UPI00344D5321